MYLPLSCPLTLSSWRITKAPGAFAEFCFRTFRITGDSKTIAGPRHPNTVCPPCLKSHAEAAIKGGRLFVRCPAEGCGRSLQTLELKTSLSAGSYATLVARLKESEATMAEAGECEAHPLGLELRMCPKCSVRIEKNEGCAAMQCYRCGEGFTWSSAELVGAEPRTAARSLKRVERVERVSVFALGLGL